MAEKIDLKNLDDSLSALEAVVRDLENSNLPIDVAIEKYAEGMKLAVMCRRSLNDMTRKVEKVRQEAVAEMNQALAEGEAVKAELAQNNQAQVAPPQGMSGFESNRNVQRGNDPALPNQGSGNSEDIPF